MDTYITMWRSSAAEKWDMRHCNSRFSYTLPTTNIFQFQEADLSESPTTIPEVGLLLLLLVLPQERGFKKGLDTLCLHRSVTPLWLWNSLCIKLWLVLGGWGGPEIKCILHPPGASAWREDGWPPVQRRGMGTARKAVRMCSRSCLETAKASPPCGGCGQSGHLHQETFH